jgi:glycosyltransferase involved in cell wall biosynthesis
MDCRVSESAVTAQSNVSVVIPAFNVARYVEDALQSVAWQTLRPAEIIVVDDGSTDGTRALLDRLQIEKQNEWPELVVVHQSNQGAGAARNAGLKRARGIFVGMLDADDRWNRHMLEFHLEVLESHMEVAVTFNWFRSVDADGRPTGSIGRPSMDSISAEKAFSGAGIIGSIVVVRRDAVLSAGGFDESLRACQNFDLWLRLKALNGNAFHCIPEVLTDYRQRPDQITSDWGQMIEYWERVIASERLRCPALTDPLEREARARHRLNLAARATGAGGGRAARQLLLQAWSQRPSLIALTWEGWRVLTAVLLSSLPPAISGPLFRVIRWSMQNLKIMTTGI